MNSWRIKRAYKHRLLPPLNTRESMERENAVPFIALQRALLEFGNLVSKAIMESVQPAVGFSNEKIEELRKYFMR